VWLINNQIIIKLNMVHLMCIVQSKTASLL